jgi:hypothetical protein
MEGFLALLSGILFSIVIWAIAKDRIDTVRERDAEQQRRLTLVALRKQYIEASDDVPDAWDRFGDALRAAEQPADAIVDKGRGDCQGTGDVCVDGHKSENQVGPA